MVLFFCILDPKERPSSRLPAKGKINPQGKSPKKKKSETLVESEEEIEGIIVKSTIKIIFTRIIIIIIVTNNSHSKVWINSEKGI